MKEEDVWRICHSDSNTTDTRYKTEFHEKMGTSYSAKFDKVILSETNWEKLSANINAKTETVYTYDDDHVLIQERTEHRFAAADYTTPHKSSICLMIMNPTCRLWNKFVHAIQIISAKFMTLKIFTIPN